MTTAKKFTDRVRFNWGFWDGHLRAELNLGYRYEHFDKVYLAGEHKGMTSFKNSENPTTSNKAWREFKLEVK